MYFARARTRAHNDKQTGRSMHTLGKHEGRTAAHRKNWLMNRSRREKTTETRKNLPIFGLYFLKDRSKKHMLRTENIFLHTRNSMKKEDLRRDKEDIRRLEKNA